MGPPGIRINCPAPAAVLNEKMTTTMTNQQLQDLATTFPLRRFGHPDDVANAAALLLSDDASWITGVTLDINGGQSTT